MYTIEKGILPKVKTKPDAYPFKGMEIGDSFFVPTSKVYGEDARLRKCASMYSIVLGYQFVVRQVEGGKRCWRIA